MYDRDFVSLFWSKVLKTSKCWLWQAGKTKAGYGQIQARRFSPAPMLCHRIAWEITNGPIPDQLHVLHDCDNPACVNPKHLFLGTQKDNNDDRDRKGRTASGDQNGARTKPQKNPFIKNRGSGLKGEKHPMCKLSDFQIARIRECYSQGATQTSLATEYGVSITHIGRIVKRRNKCRVSSIKT